MKHIFLNLKRFDISPLSGGVNRIAPIQSWGSYIIEQTQNPLSKYNINKANFVMFFPEAHIPAAVRALGKNSPVKIGCQSVYRDDTSVGGNFGAFTSNLTANAAAQLGCKNVLIGHCEERNDKSGILYEAGLNSTDAINRILNKEILAAQVAGLSVLYCIGEKAEEQHNWQDVLGKQLEVGLANTNMQNITIAYEPIWSIGPGKIPADKEYITKIARFVKEKTGGANIVYGGGLKADNAAMLASIPEIDGGLIALTRFSGEIGFYPNEYLEIIKLYLSHTF